LAKGKIEAQQLEGLAGQLLAKLEADNMAVQWVDGSETTSGYEVGGVPQADYIKATENKNFAMLWLSPLARAGYRQQDQNSWQTAQFNALDINTASQSLDRHVQETGFVGQPENLSAIKTLLFNYMDNPDVLRLQQIHILAREQQYQLIRLLDPSSKQAFLVIHNNTGKILAIANLIPRGRTVTLIDSHSSADHQLINFINQRNAWLQPGKTDETL
jgi:hypothetical protein